MEKLYNFKNSEEKLIEKILDDDVVMINHMILNQEEALPEHDSNSNVYMMVIQGKVTLQLSETPAKEYKQGSIINIPAEVKMNVSNKQKEQLEIFVIKAPSPRLYNQKSCECSKE